MMTKLHASNLRDEPSGEPGIWTHLRETLHIWRRRYQDRQELARWTDWDLHDIGLSRSDIASEVEKPFWRA